MHLVSHLVGSFFLLLLLLGIYQRSSPPWCLACKCSHVLRSGQEVLSRWCSPPSVAEKRVLNFWYVLWVHIAVRSCWLSTFFPHSPRKDTRLSGLSTWLQEFRGKPLSLQLHEARWADLVVYCCWKDNLVPLLPANHTQCLLCVWSSPWQTPLWATSTCSPSMKKGRIFLS